MSWLVGDDEGPAGGAVVGVSGVRLYDRVNIGASLIVREGVEEEGVGDERVFVEMGCRGSRSNMLAKFTDHYMLTGVIAPAKMIMRGRCREMRR